MLDRTTVRKLGSVWAIVQGASLAAAPGFNAKFIRKAVRENFENASELEARPGYLRQLRAAGIGLIAAGLAGLVLESKASDGSSRTDDAEPVE